MTSWSRFITCCNQFSRVADNCWVTRPFQLPAQVEAVRPKLDHWAGLIASRRIDTFNEQQILPDFLTDFFVAILGYTRPRV